MFLENRFCKPAVFRWAGGPVAEVPAAWGQQQGLPLPAVHAKGRSELCPCRPSAPSLQINRQIQKEKK